MGYLEHFSVICVIIQGKILRFYANMNLVSELAISIQFPIQTRNSFILECVLTIAAC